MACPSYVVAPGGSASTPAGLGEPVALTAINGTFGSPTGSVDLICGDGTRHVLTVSTWTPAAITVTLPSSLPCAGPFFIAVNSLTDNDCRHQIFIGGVMAQPPDYEALASQILMLTQVDWDPKNPKAGESTVVRVIPGYTTSSPIGGKLPGNFDLLLQSLVKNIGFKVTYTVLKPDGQVAKEVKVEPLAPSSPAGSDPLEAVITVLPPFVDELHSLDPVNFRLLISITVTVENIPKTGSVTVPLPIPPVPVPGVLLLSADASHTGRLFIMVRAASALGSAGAIVNSLNSIIQVVNSFKDIIGMATLLTPLHAAVDTINSAPQIVGVASGGQKELDDADNFDNEASSLLLLAPTGTKVALYNHGDFNDVLTPFQEKHVTTITAKDIAPLGSPIGIGFVDEPDWSHRAWDNSDGNDFMNDDTESTQFLP